MPQTKFYRQRIGRAFGLVLLGLVILFVSGGGGLGQGVPPTPPKPPTPGAPTPELLCTLTSPNMQAGGDFGTSVALGDMTGDGIRDIFVSAPFETVDGLADVGRVYIFDGHSCQLIRTYTPPVPQKGSLFGMDTRPSHITMDGKKDLAVGAPGEDVSGNEDQGRVYAYDGATGKLLFQLDSPLLQAKTGFGMAVAIGDVDGDGRGEVVVGSPLAGAGKVYAFSGRDGKLLLTIDMPAPQAGAQFGSSVGFRPGWRREGGVLHRGASRRRQWQPGSRPGLYLLQHGTTAQNAGYAQPSAGESGGHGERPMHSRAGGRAR